MVMNRLNLTNSAHYANTTMQYTAIFHGCKNVYFQMIFFISNEYPQSMFCSKNKKKYTPVNPSLTIL